VLVLTVRQRLGHALL